jgi:YegS/Rv2252/BmrU family lipid kinase
MRALDAAGTHYVSEFTQGPGHAIELASRAVSEGHDAVVAIGGDGTLHEVVNGVVRAAVAENETKPKPAVGLVQAGTGSDFGRSAGVPSDLESACARLVARRIQVIDLGRVEYQTFDGRVESRYFANSAGLGFDAEVALRTNRAPRVLGSTLPYLSSLVMTLGTYRNKRITLRADEGAEWHGRINSIVIANGQYFGGGMRIAPNAEIADGEFEVVILGDVGKLDLMRNVPRVYDGSHLSHPKVRAFRARQIEVSSPDHLLLQADGEVLGTAPASLSVLPSALRLIV